MQFTPTWPPVNGNVVVVLWLKDDGIQAIGVWQVLQLVENLAVV
jgi:hypothetical protein